MLQAISLESQLVQNANGKSGMMVRVRTEEAAVCATRYKEVDRDVMQVSMEQNYEKANLGYSKHKRGRGTNCEKGRQLLIIGQI